MPPTPEALPFKDWIIEALTALGGTATELAVAKEIWSRHGTEIQDVGDFMYTWQLDTHKIADILASEGRISVSGDGWGLSSGTVSTGWGSETIQVAVEGYISLLRADHEGRPSNRRQTVAEVVAQTGQTATAVDAMFANVSAVVQEHGYEYLAAYPPKSNVPRGVRPAVAVALNL